MVSMDNKALEAKESSFRGADLKLFVRDVRDRQGRIRPITVRSWSTIKDVKDTIYKSTQVPAQNQRLFFGPLLTSGKELLNYRTLHDSGIYRSGETLLLDIKGRSTGVSTSSARALEASAKSDICISSSMINSSPRLLKQLVQQARRALNLGLKPEFILEGSGGTYFLHDPKKVKIAVFKPADEEPYAENNPRGYLPHPGQDTFLREGVKPGEACIREVAAFMLDHGGFSGVPMTTLVEAKHPCFNANGSRLTVAGGGASIGAHSINGSQLHSDPPKKVGSFQEFVRCDYTMDDLSPSKLSVDEVHKIAVLDIRLMNADRNSANLLCRHRADNSIELVPIDHGFCLRSVADVSWMDWCWLDWPQMKAPMSKTTKDYILNMDIEKDARLLKERLNICREALDYFCASCSILKAGVKSGLTLYDIAVMCCRNDNMGEVPSKLEILFSMAEELAESAIENGRWHHTAALKALEDQLSPKGASLLAPVDGKRLSKAKSAVDLVQFSDGLANLVRDKQEVPEMIQSNASDSSSDTAEAEREDSEEREDIGDWATSLIADVSFGNSMPFIHSKPRTMSIESDSSSESDGFWHRPPGASPDVSDDDESVNWSLSSSPRNSSLMMSNDSLEDEMKKSYNPIAERRSSIVLTDLPKEMKSSFIKSPSKVSFPAHVLEESEKKTTGNAKFKHSNSDVGDSSHFSNMVKKKTDSIPLRRSQSYSALTSAQKRAPEDEKIVSHPGDHEQYRDYFLKFVDLVIVRETTAAGRLAKQQG